MERLQSASVAFLEGILSILKSNAVKVLYSTEIRMDHDIVRYVFKGKGKRAEDGVSILYEKNDFTRFELPPYWYYTDTSFVFYNWRDLALVGVCRLLKQR